MTREAKKYFEFLVEAIELDDRTEQYSMLLEYLFEEPFIVDKHFELDEDRVENGLEMREKYIDIYVSKDSRDDFIREFDRGFKGGISVLEFFISLSEKMSEMLYFDSHRNEFFWQIIDNLGLNCMDDGEFDQAIVDDILEKLFNRRYGRDGSGGGMFYVPNSKFNLTNLDFLRQAQIWLSHNFV